MLTIQGKGVSSGISIGPLHFIRRFRQAIARRKVMDTAAEWQRFQEAQAKAIESLGKLAEKARTEVGDEAALLFETHQMMAEDLDYVEAIQTLVEDGLNAEAAVTDVAAQFAEMFASMDDEYMQARAADVKDVSGRIVSLLQGLGDNGMDIDTPVILVAEDLSPSEAVQLDRKCLLGIVTSGGSSSGHTAILARAMGIPAVIGVGDALEPEYEGREVILDGGTGRLVLDADAAFRDSMLKKQAEQTARKRQLEQLKGAENISLDGQKIEINCNIAGLDDLAAVEQNDGGGVGLFRSEFLYLAGHDYPTEEQLFETYGAALAAMEGKKMIIRTMDIGADKQADYFGLEKEENPAMGLRGLRLCLERPEIFRTQLRALYRASAYGKLGIMVPMVTSVWEFLECKHMCQTVQEELRREGLRFDPAVELGVMIETPAAVFVSDQLAKEADFFSIGTNDLTQYTLACDRQNSNLGRFYDPHHPAVLREIKIVVDNAHKHGKWVGICGELGADPELTPLFLSLGVDELSVTPDMVLPLRAVVRDTNAGAVREKLLAELLSD